MLEIRFDPRALRARKLGVVLLVSALSLPALAGPAGDSRLRVEAGEPIRGMTVSCPTWGPIWGSPRMVAALEELAPLGVEWISIHPYAGVRRDGTVRSRPIDEMDFLPRAVKIVREAGMKLFWKPHLAYWGSFEWRGSIEFGDDEAKWRRFFDSYERFIVEQARFAERHRVPLFAIGLEYEATTHHEQEWRRLIRAVREVYSGRVTYSANWDRLDAVPFWDALDLIGVQGYFPLAPDGNERPTREQIRSRWDGPIEQLRALHARHEKPVLFAEIGYDLASSAAHEPWRNASHDTAENRALRRRLMEEAIVRLEAEPFIEGMFWWKWIPGASPSRDFAMQHPEARDVLRRAWSVSGSSKSEPASPGAR